MDRLREIQRLGQSVWYDNISRDLLESGEIAGLVEAGVTGLTSNPTIFEKAISAGAVYDDALAALAAEGLDAVTCYESLAFEDIRCAADLLRPAYDASGGDGFACLEVSPRLAHDTEATVAEALRLFAALDRPNAMIKVPATPEGIPAIRRLTGSGINVNVTLIFSLEAHRNVMDAYISGLEDLAAAGGDVSSVASVASFFVSRVDTAVDGLLSESGASAELMGKAAIANARLAYRSFCEAFGGERFAALRAKGARVQRPLWASTSTKNPAYSDLLYIDNLIGPDTVNTMPPATLTAFIDHGEVRRTIDSDDAGAEQTLADLEAAGVSMDAVTGKLLADGVKAFADSFELLLANVEAKRALLLEREAAETVRP
ncbi:MAG: transaldolase [Chloroflexota bacterium]|nr:transaldolase [Chloroflexota bacterium]MDE2940758.1 transaldolase [Chloroflexota bacterium]MDE3266940.1 transaldolase [Chloroflexota bacterium]